MFYEAAICRKIHFEKNKHDPLTLEEIIAATRIQKRYNLHTKKMEFIERPFRQYWIILLNSIGEIAP